MFKMFQQKSKDVVPPGAWTLPEDMTLEQARVEMVGLLAQDDANHHRLGVLYNYVVDKKLPQAEEAREGSEAAARKERMKERKPRVDWAELLKRTFDFEVFACVRCGGRRRVLAYVKAGRGVRAILEHRGLPTAGVSLAPAQESTQAAWC